MVMLPPEQVGGARGPAPGADIAEVRTEPVRAKPLVMKPAPARLPERETAAGKSARAVAARPAPVKTAAVRPTASAKQASARKTRETGAPKPSVVPETDSDVALLSAIVAHSSRHAAERARLESCKLRKCPAAEPAEP
ncbi:hypothetical protein D3872_17945 [Massilia cavernae]|uniref:Uncharacterized protein n=2 Tax=Massilia cavernae TaxID=2320864 RepID=A0A418XH42_9BURK|nr:hypothetical protein D3872_17945 [Massilia cavernae]